MSVGESYFAADFMPNDYFALPLYYWPLFEAGAERLSAISSESRLEVVSAEARVESISASDRIESTSGESRTFEVPNEDRLDEPEE